MHIVNCKNLCLCLTPLSTFYSKQNHFKIYLFQELERCLGLNGAYSKTVLANFQYSCIYILGNI